MLTNPLQYLNDFSFAGDMYSPALILSAVGCAEANSEHPIAAAILKYVREVLGCELMGSSTNFQVSSF